MRQRRRRSTAITLVLIGTITGCSEPVPQRDVYQSLAQCRQDWDQQQCEPARDNRYAPGYYYGPSYYGSARPDGTPKPSRNAMDAVRAPGRPVSSSSTTTSRGGFGSSSRSYSSFGS